VETATHLGIKRSKTDKETIKNTVDENIKKARRTAYSLMSAGFHGNNVLDPAFHLYDHALLRLEFILFNTTIIICHVEHDLGLSWICAI
jgi:hypothetical protein